MKLKIEDRKYNYNGYDVCSIYGTLNIYDDAELNIISSTQLIATYNLNQPDFLAEINRQITTQISEYITKLMELDAMRLSIFPQSTSFEHAVNLIFDPIQEQLGA